MWSSTLNRSVLFTTLCVKRLSDPFAPRVSYVNEAIVVVVVFFVQRTTPYLPKFSYGEVYSFLIRKKNQSTYLE